MPYYKVTKTMQYTETVYVVAESKRHAEDLSGSMDGAVNHDDMWYDSDACEIDENEFMMECGQ